jgi:hypothetical protein
MALRLALVSILVAGILAPVAGADPPEHIPFPPSEPFVIEGSCDFPVLLEEVVNKEKLTVFSDGREIITGSLKVRLTNLDDPSSSLLLNISGPAFFTPRDDGGFSLKATGSWLWFFAPGELGEGSPGMMFTTHGQARLVVTGEGDTSFELLSGTRGEVCPRLA